MQWSPKTLGMTLGLLAGGAWLIIMGLSLTTGFLDQTVQSVGGLHPGFSYSWNGLWWVVAMHLVGGFVLGYAIGWIYNKFNK